MEHVTNNPRVGREAELRPQHGPAQDFRVGLRWVNRCLWRSFTGHCYQGEEVKTYLLVVVALFLASIYGLATSNMLVVGLAFSGYYINDYLTQE